MAKRLIKGVIVGLKRDGKAFDPRPGTVVDLTQDEIKQIEEVNKAAIGLPPDDSNDKTVRVTGTNNRADTPVTTDPVNSGSLGGDGGAEGDNDALRAGMNPDPKPAVDGNLKVKGAPQTANPKPGPANISGSKSGDDDL